MMCNSRVKAGADVVVVDGMQGGTAATQEVFIEHVGIPTLPATRMAVDALKDIGMHREVQLIVSGGIRSGADVAKALALGADAVSIGTAALIAIAMGDNSPERPVRKPTKPKNRRKKSRNQLGKSNVAPATTTTINKATTRPEYTHQHGQDANLAKRLNPKNRRKKSRKLLCGVRYVA